MLVVLLVLVIEMVAVVVWVCVKTELVVLVGVLVLVIEVVTVVVWVGGFAG